MNCGKKTKRNCCGYADRTSCPQSKMRMNCGTDCVTVLEFFAVMCVCVPVRDRLANMVTFVIGISTETIPKVIVLFVMYACVVHVCVCLCITSVRKAVFGCHSSTFPTLLPRNTKTRCCYVYTHITRCFLLTYMYMFFAGCEEMRQGRLWSFGSRKGVYAWLYTHVYVRTYVRMYVCMYVCV